MSPNSQPTPDNLDYTRTAMVELPPEKFQVIDKFIELGLHKDYWQLVDQVAKDYPEQMNQGIRTALETKEVRQRLTGEPYNMLSYAQLKAHPEYGHLQITSPQETRRVITAAYSRFSKNYSREEAEALGLKLPGYHYDWRGTSTALLRPDAFLLQGNRLAGIAEYRSFLTPKLGRHLRLVRSFLEILPAKSAEDLRDALAEELGLNSLQVGRPGVIYVLGARCIGF